MSNRKQTPDVLGEILGGAASPAPTAASTASPTRRRQPAKAKPASQPAQLARPTTPPPAPPQWEYREVVFREYRGWRPRLVNGRESSTWKDAPLIHDYLKQVGDEGWELVSMGDPYHNQKEAYFKRPKG